MNMSESVSEQLAQKQLEAYNSKDVEAFLKCYSHDVEIYSFPDELVYVGKDTMRERYSSLFEAAPNLNAEIVTRTVMGNVAIDVERVTGMPGKEQVNAIAIYEVENDLIKKVRFIRE
jgi:hypothetical protein